MLIVLAQPLVAILLNHLNARTHLAVGTVLAVLAAGLPGFTVFQLCVRGLQSMQRAREVFLLYVLDNALTIVLCVVLGRHSIAGLTASVSIGYVVAAAAALVVLAHYQVNIITGVWSVHVRRSLVASLVAAAVIAVVYAVPSWTRGAARRALRRRGRRRRHRVRPRRRGVAPPGSTGPHEKCKAWSVLGGTMARIRVVTDSASDLPE